MADPTVIVVEDDENVRYVTVAALRLNQFTVVEAASGRELLQLVNSDHSADLVVLDVTLPDIDGFEACRRLRADGIDIPIVFLTARDTPADRLQGLTIGADDYLTKPFSVEELVARVRIILRRSGASVREQALSCGHVDLDEDAHIVRAHGVALALSPTEYKLLRFLLRNKGRALTRNQILDHVWDYDFHGESTVVETFVSTLRKKVDPDGCLIYTVRGVGYRLGD